MKVYKVKFYRSGLFRKQWRWRIKADNGKVIGASTESFKNLEDCKHNAEIVSNSLTGWVLVTKRMDSENSN